MHGGTVKLAVR